MSQPAIAWSSGPAISLLSAPRWTPRADGCSTPESTARYGISPWSYSPARHGECRTQPRDVELQGTHFPGFGQPYPGPGRPAPSSPGSPYGRDPSAPGSLRRSFESAYRPIEPPQGPRPEDLTQSREGPSCRTRTPRCASSSRSAAGISPLL